MCKSDEFASSNQVGYTLAVFESEQLCCVFSNYQTRRQTKFALVGVDMPHESMQRFSIR